MLFRQVDGEGADLVALQDVCGWMMKKAGIRPRPFRSRLLLWIPLAAGLYMFVWPTFKRVAVLPWLENAWPAAAAYLGPVAAFSGFSNHFVTDDFWATFPGPWFTLLTFATYFQYGLLAYGMVLLAVVTHVTVLQRAAHFYREAKKG